MDEIEWEVVLVAEVADWYARLCQDDWCSAEQVEDAIDMLAWRSWLAGSTNERGQLG